MKDSYKLAGTDLVGHSQFITNSKSKGSHGHNTTCPLHPVLYNLLHVYQHILNLFLDIRSQIPTSFPPDPNVKFFRRFKDLVFKLRYFSWIYQKISIFTKT